MKTKLGISVGFLAAMTYLAAMAGITPLILVAGYIFLMEESDFLKKTAVKALVIFFGVAVCGFLINLFPTVANLALSFLHIFKVDISLPSTIINAFNWLNSVLGVARNVLLVLLAVLALREKTIKAPVIDKIEL